ncbi:3-isopropylmalate dehydratase [Roseomonas sp. AR75]|uniref:3-isopropylmalate dehydratase n=1 Tax=Roseomonas sp. AR75 TaxID=2562311 RepID=UPI0010BF7858|nr:3-isopropylmalate dehydratase [Roseomonas sp. AR75]
MSGTLRRGRVWKFGDHVSGDDGIIDFAAVATGFGKAFDTEKLRRICFTLLRPEFPDQVQQGDIVVAGVNFGHHNHVDASVAMRVSGISVVIVESCESGLVRRALNVGLPIMTCPGITAAVADGEILEADPATGTIRTASGQTLQARPFSPRMLDIWQAGGVIELLEQEAVRRGEGAALPEPLLPGA